MLAQISDLHLLARRGATLLGVDPQEQLERTLADVARFRPDLVVVTGDVAHDGAPASYRALKRALATLACPNHVIPGNHDDPEALGATLGHWPLLSRVGVWRLVLLNTHRPGQESGAVRDSELASAARGLALEPTAPVLVAMHHPPVAVGSPWIDATKLENTGSLRRWVRDQPMLKRILTGHVHQASLRRFGPASVLTAPATCAQFVPNSLRCRIEDRRPGWRALWLHPDGGVTTRLCRLRAP